MEELLIIMNYDGMSLKKNFWRFIWPSVIAQWIFALYTMVDGMFVARGVSEVALSAVNIASPFVNFLFSVSILFAVGASTIVAIYLGQGNHEDANQVYTQNMIVLSVLSFLIMGVVIWRLNDIAVFLGATEVTMDYVKSYLLSVVPFTWSFIISYSFEILVKTDGYPRFATIAATTGAVLNCILDYLFVMVFHWGVAGAGVATGISQTVLVVMYLTHFLSPKATIKFVKVVWSAKELVRGIKIGLASGLTEFSAGITVFLFNHAILTNIGEDGIVSYTIIAYVSTIVVMSMAGIAQGTQPLISYYYGKGEREKYKTLFQYALTATIGLAGVAFVSAWFGADLLVGVFVSPQLGELRAYSSHVFRIFSISFLIMGFNVVSGGFFTAIERPKSSLAISLGRGFVMLVIALKLCVGIAGGEGIWWASTVSELLCLLVTAGLMFRYTKTECNTLAEEKSICGKTHTKTHKKTKYSGVSDT